MLQNANGAALLNQKKAKYSSARISILLIIILSVVNLFSIVFADSYFLFSSYLTQLIGLFGGVFYIETGILAYLIAGIALGIISLVPYLLCFIFSKNKTGWMIAAEVLFALDSLLFLVDFVPLVLSGDMSMLVDLVIRIYALGSIGYGIKCGLDMKKLTAAEALATPAPGFTVAEENTPVGEPAAEADPALAGITRGLHIERRKAFYGCAATFRCLVDGNPVGELKNGKSLDLTVDGNAHRITVAFSGVESTADIPAGSESKSFAVSLKMGATAGTLVLTELA